MNELNFVAERPCSQGHEVIESTEGIFLSDSLIYLHIERTVKFHLYFLYANAANFGYNNMNLGAIFSISFTRAS